MQKDLDIDAEIRRLQ
jgi:seryl-tRNA synthetase